MNKKTEARGIKIDTDTLALLAKAVKQAGSIRKLGLACNVTASTISRWMGNVANRNNECIDWPNWEKLWAYLVKHGLVPPDDRRWMPPSAMRDALVDGRVKPSPASNVDFDVPRLRPFPVVSSAAAAEVNTTYYPLAEYASQTSGETATFTSGRPGDFVIRVTGDSMKPWYPPGTLLLVRPHQHIRNGDRVVAVLANGDVLFKCFVERKNSIMLLAINGDEGQHMEFKKNDYAAIRDLYRVVQSLKLEDDVDGAMRERGIEHFWEKYKEEDK